MNKYCLRSDGEERFQDRLTKYFGVIYFNEEATRTSYSINSVISNGHHSREEAEENVWSFPCQALLNQDSLLLQKGKSSHTWILKTDHSTLDQSKESEVPMREEIRLSINTEKFRCIYQYNQISDNPSSTF